MPSLSKLVTGSLVLTIVPRQLLGPLPLRGAIFVIEAPASQPVAPRMIRIRESVRAETLLQTNCEFQIYCLLVPPRVATA